MSVTPQSRAPSGEANDRAPLAALRNASAVRERCLMVRDWVRAGRSPHFSLDEGKMADVAGYVADVTRGDYPDLKIPPHSRWRHFAAGGTDRWSEIAARIADRCERARAAIDLATVSVLLDAGAGDRWRYREAATGQELARSEGLAVASLAMFADGQFSAAPGQPLRADAEALLTFDAAKLARGFQADATANPLIGLEQRAALLRRLGQAIKSQPDLFGNPARPGALADYLAARSRDNRVPAPQLLTTLLNALAPIWPSGLIACGSNIGDAGMHPAVRTDDITSGIVPFHKLSQWLAYSLIEPLELFGLTVVDIDGLTALAEYRNGGLLIDLGVIRPRHPFEGAQAVASELVTEWRALTVAQMDDLLAPVRQRLALGADFELPQLLQGGTWSAGRKIAFKLRPATGEPPILLATDGSIF